MASYLIQASYTPEAWAAMLKNPQDRSEAIRAVVEKLGGRIGQFWFTFGDYDALGVLDMPDGVSAAALSMAVSAGGACRSVKTTPLLSVAEGLDSMKKAAICGYKPVTQAAAARK